MKLTPRAQGYRFSCRLWEEEGDFIDIRRVGKPDSLGMRVVNGVNSKGKKVHFAVHENDGNWIRLGSTVLMKRLEE